MSEISLSEVRRYGLVVFDWVGKKTYYLDGKKAGASKFEFENVGNFNVEGDSAFLDGVRWTVDSVSPMGILPIGALRDSEAYHRLSLEKLSYEAEIERLGELRDKTSLKMNEIYEKEGKKIPEDIPFWLSTISLDDTYERRREFLWAHGVDSHGFYQSTMQQALFLWRHAGQDAIVAGITEITPYLLPIDGEYRIIGYISHSSWSKYIKTKDGKSWWLEESQYHGVTNSQGPMPLQDAVRIALTEMEEDEC